MLRFALSGLVAVALSAGAGSAADQQSQIQAAYDRQCKAAIGKDGSAFAGTLGPDFVFIDLDRNQQKAGDVVDAISTPPQGTIFERCNFVIREFQSDGATATVLETQTSTGTMTSEGASKPFVRVEDKTDVWKISGRPLEIASQITGLRLTLDGLVIEDRGILASPEP
jgi:hypothetical protein